MKKLTKEIHAVDGDLNTEGYSDQYQAGGFVVNTKPNKSVKGGVDVTYSPGQLHHLIIGSTGSGKTVGPINQTIVSVANSKSSMIISDPKGELYKTFSPYLRDKGYQIHLLDYFDVSSGIRFNQLQLINNAYREGLPHYYANIAIEAIIKLTDNIRYNGEVDPEEELKAIIYSANSRDFSIPAFDIQPFRPQDHFRSVVDDNFIAGPDQDNAALYVALLQEFFHAVVDKIAEYESNSSADTNSANDFKHRNAYYIARLTETVHQAIKILNECSMQTILDFFTSQEQYYAQLLEMIPDENLQKKSFVSTHERYIALLTEIEESVASAGSDYIPIVIFEQYMEERRKLEAATFKSVEERAVKNANTIAEIIVEAANEGGKKGEKIWTETPKALISALTIMTCRDGLTEAQKHLGSVYLQLANLTEDLPGGKMGQSSNKIDRIFQHYNATDFAKLSLAAVKAAGDRTKSSIIVSAIPPMRVWSEPSVVAQSCATDLELESIVEKPTAIFLNFGGADSSNTYTFLVTLFIEQMYTVLNDMCARTEKLSLPRPVYYILDEFLNLPDVPNIGPKISLARSKNIRFEMVAQSISQFDGVYTKDVRNTVVENCNLIYLLTNNTETAKFFAERLGKYTIQVENKSEGSSNSANDKGGSSSSSSTTSTSKMGRELMTAEELMNIQKNHGIYIAPRMHPFKIQYMPSYEWPLFQKDIFPNALREIHQKRPHYDPEYFLPEDHEHFIFSYMAINNGCLFDELFNAWWKAKAGLISQSLMAAGGGSGGSGSRDVVVEEEIEEDYTSSINMEVGY